MQVGKYNVHIEPNWVFEDVKEEFSHFEGDLDVVVDMGAHHGSLTFLALDKGASLVHVVEPATYSTIYESAEKNGLLDKIKIHPFAIGAEDGFRRFAYGDRGVGLGFSDKGVFVPVRSFYSFMEEIGPVSYLKIDIESAETELVKDKERFITALRDVSYIHVEDHEGYLLDVIPVLFNTTSLVRDDGRIIYVGHKK